jgi:hypothetical protein
MKNSTPRRGKAAFRPTDRRIGGQDDWRVKTLEEVRRLIKQADPEMVEERKWKKPSNPSGIPVWSHNGNVCTGETYKNAVKLTFFKGASLKDPSGLFNQPGTLRRAINIHEGDKINETALKALILEAVALNLAHEE